MSYIGRMAIFAALVLGGCGFWNPGPSSEEVAIEHFVAAQLLLDEQKTDEALAELDLAIQADGDLAVAYAAIGRIFYSQEQFEPAAGAYRQAVRANPFDLDLQEHLADCYDRLGQPEKAEQIRNRADAAHPAP